MVSISKVVVEYHITLFNVRIVDPLLTNNSINYCANPSCCDQMLLARLPDVEQPFCDGRMLIGDGCAEMGRQTCQGYRQHPSRLTTRFESSWSGAVRTLGTHGSYIGSAENSTCAAESVDRGFELCQDIHRNSVNKWWTLS